MKAKQWESHAANSSPILYPISFKKLKSSRKSTSTLPNPNHAILQQLPDFTHRRHWHILTTTVSSSTASASASASASATPFLYAYVDGENVDVDGDDGDGDDGDGDGDGDDGDGDGDGDDGDGDGDDVGHLLHPFTLKPHTNNRTVNYDLLNRLSTVLFSFDHTLDFPFEKLVIPLPRAATIDGDSMVVLYGGGKLLGRLPVETEQNLVKWVVLSENKFDDIVGSIGYTYTVDRLGRLYVINSIKSWRDLRLGTPVINRSISHGSGRVRWRKRLVIDRRGLCMVVRVEEKVFRVYELTRGRQDWWDDVSVFGGAVLVVSKDCCFFMDHFGVEEYKNCILFSESGFPKYGDDCWKYNDEDKIGVFRITDKRFGWVGESADFPDIDWSPPSWIYVRDLDKDDGGVQSNAANVEGDTLMQEDVPASLFASVAAVEEDVTRALLCINGGNEATEKESSRKNTIVSALRACTSSSTTQGDKSDFVTAKFEGFNIRSELVPTLQKIWRNHGNIIENSTIRSSDIIARALESLANMVQTLENNAVESLTDYQAEYLSSTLCDLKFMGFKVHWLVSFVEKAVKLHKSKALVNSLNKLTELSTQVQERRDILLDGVAKLNEEENKLKKEMAKVSKLIPFLGKAKFDELLGSGLT